MLVLWPYLSAEPLVKWLTASLTCAKVRCSYSKRNTEQLQQGDKNTSVVIERAKECECVWERDRQRESETYNRCEQPSPCATITGTGKQVVTYFRLYLWKLDQSNSTYQTAGHWEVYTCVSVWSYTSIPVIISYPLEVYTSANLTFIHQL